MKEVVSWLSPTDVLKKSKGLSLIIGRETIKIPHVAFIFISPKKDKVKRGLQVNNRPEGPSQT